MQSGVRALVATVDDDRIILNTILNILKPYYDVRPFTSGRTFLKFLDSASVDLVLLDYSMPGMDGFEVMAHLQEDEKMRDIPILFLTSKGDTEREILALEKGAADFFRKPIEPRVLLTRVHHQMELQRYRQHMKAQVEEKTRDLMKVCQRLELREDATLNMLAMATDMRDHSTGDHIRRTTEFVRLIVQALMDHPKTGYILTREEANDIVRSSKLHDVGKIAVPDHILGKAGRLTDEEFAIVMQHPVSGANFLDAFVDEDGQDPFLATARDIALYHHEKWDGSGYPFGLEGENIPLSARIAALADVYDALISVRPYKGALTHDEAFGIITRECGRYFDPYLVEMFIRCSEAFRGVLLTAVETGGTQPDMRYLGADEQRENS